MEKYDVFFSVSQLRFLCFPDFFSTNPESEVQSFPSCNKICVLLLLFVHIMSYFRSKKLCSSFSNRALCSSGRTRTKVVLLGSKYNLS